MLLPYVLAFCRITIGLVFVVSFIGKVSNLAAFERTITAFHLLPKQFNRATALLFLSGELAVVLLVISGGKLIGFGFTLAIFLLFAFSIALVSVLARRIRTSCNCFGSSEKLVSPDDVWRNTGLILCALVGLGAFAVSKSDQLNLGMTELSMVGVAAAVFVAIWLQFGEIVQLVRHG